MLLRTVPDVPHELSRGSKPGQWWPFRENGRLKAMLRCPLCGIPAFLARHVIDRDGEVTPEFQCQRLGCSFKATLRLLGWKQDVFEQHG